MSTGVSNHRPLRAWTQALTAVTGTYLLLHLVRAMAPLATDNFEVVAALDLGLKVFALVVAGVTLAWLYRASRIAHTFSSDMRYSPAAAVAWFFVPFVNLLYAFAAVYEIWAKSGGPKRSSLLITWWGLTILTIYVVFPVWVTSGTTTLGAHLLLAAAPITFLVLAHRVEGFQALSAVADEFGDEVAPEPEPPGLEAAARPPPYVGAGTIEDPHTTGTLDPVVAAPAVRLAPSPLGKPGVILIKRPAPGPERSPDT